MIFVSNFEHVHTVRRSRKFVTTQRALTQNKLAMM